MYIGDGEARERLAQHGGSPVRILLDVVVGGCTVKEAGVKGLALLSPGEHPGDGAETHLLFLLFPLLVF